MDFFITSRPGLGPDCFQGNHQAKKSQQKAFKAILFFVRIYPLSYYEQEHHHNFSSHNNDVG